jgi:hypothetical protein
METPQSKPSRLKRFFRRALFAVAVLITLAALIIAEEDWRGARAWQNYKQQMEAKGEHFDAARLIPPKVPDDQNFAMTPLFAPIFNLPPGDPNPPLNSATNIVHGEPLAYYVATNRGLIISPPWFDSDVKRAPHPLGWNYGMAADLTGWAAVIQGTNSASPSAGTADPVRAASIILDNMKSCESMLTELQTATTRPYCRFNISCEEWDKPDAQEVLMQHFVLIKWLFRFLSLHAEAAMVGGHAEQALKDIQVMFRVDDGLKDEPLMISQLVRIACAALLLQSVGEGLAEHRWSDAQLRVLQDRLQKTDLIASTVLGLYGERDICQNPSFDKGYMSPSGWNRLEQLNVNREYQVAVFPRIDLSAREINPSVNRSIDLVVQKLTEGGGIQAFLHHSVMAIMLMPVYSKVPPKTAFAQTQVDMAMLACALERYRLAQGQYPEALNDLVPRFAAALPHDIINGQPLHYRRTEDGRFLLYSVGWNEKDDGGVVAPTKDNPPRQDNLQGDWVWEYPEKN